MDKKKKIIIAIVANIIALTLIVMIFTGQSDEEMLISTGEELQPKFISLIEKCEIFKGSAPVLTPQKVYFEKMKKRKWRIYLTYEISGNKEFTGVSLQLEGKISDSEFVFDTVNQGYKYIDGTYQWIKFDPQQDKQLLIK
jgi:hypothetical protein